MNTITRADLTAAAQDAAVVSEADAKAVVDQTLDLIADAVIAGRKQREPVKILKFGSFVPWLAAARSNARNPKRPDELHPIPAHWRMIFRPSRELLQKMNPGKTVNRISRARSNGRGK